MVYLGYCDSRRIQNSDKVNEMGQNNNNNKRRTRDVRRADERVGGFTAEGPA